MQHSSVRKRMGVGVICMASFLFFDITFASEESTMKGVFEIFDLVLQVLSRIRIIPATLAGELLSNDLVFGSRFNFEIYLWKVWTIMRNFANFFLGGLFLYYILSYIVQSFQGTSISAFMTKIGKLLLAAILVNASFFMIRAVVDISIVATAAISSLPHAVIEERRAELSKQIDTKKVNCITNFASNPASSDCDYQENKEVGLTYVLPQADNMGGPIIFMGVAMLDLLSANEVPLSIKNRENLALATVAKVLMILLFTAPILALMVVNMMRIFYIWLWTIFSPLIIIDLVLGKEESPLSGLRGEGGTGGLAYNGLGDILGFIFVPVAVVGTLALGFILMLGLMSVIKGGEQYATWSVSNIQIDNNPPTIRVPQVVSVGVEGSLFQETGFRTLGFFGEALMVFFCMAILWGLVKVGFSTSSIAKNFSDKVFDAAGSLASAVPIIPAAGGISLSTIKSAGGATNVVKGLTGMTNIENKSKTDAQQRSKGLMEKFGIEGGGYAGDLDPETMSSITAGTSVSNIVSSIRNDVADKNRLRYTDNIKRAFETMDVETLLRDHFSGLDESLKSDIRSDKSNLYKTQGWHNFVSDVLENDTALGTYNQPGDVGEISSTRTYKN